MAFDFVRGLILAILALALWDRLSSIWRKPVKQIATTSTSTGKLSSQQQPVANAAVGSTDIQLKNTAQEAAGVSQHADSGDGETACQPLSTAELAQEPLEASETGEEDSLSAAGSSEAQAPILTVQEVKEALVLADKTQTELADALGVSRAYVSKILAGAKPLTPELQDKCRQVFSDWFVDLPESQTGGQGQHGQQI